jgi:hypothetical protein
LTRRYTVRQFAQELLKQDYADHIVTAFTVEKDGSLTIHHEPPSDGVAEKQPVAPAGRNEK